MTSQLIIDVNQRSGEAKIALLEDAQLIEFRSQKRNAEFNVGDIYVGTVRKVMQNHNAAFVDIGYKKEGFLHIKDLGPHYNFMQKQVRQFLREGGRGKAPTKVDPIKHFIFKGLEPLKGDDDTPAVPEKRGKISDFVKNGHAVLVQIAREPYSNKGPSLTTEISLAGRNLVLLPFGSRVHVSSKIESKEESARLKRLLQSILPKGLGVIVRTAAEGKKVEVLNNELTELLERWKSSLLKLQQTAKLPALLLSEINSSSAIIRDNLDGSYSSIQVNDRKLYGEIKSYLTNISPQDADIVKLYKSTKVPIFDHFDVTKQVKRLLGQTVAFHKGSYLIIQHPEAFHVIDVNSGSGAKSAETPEATAFEVNLAACDEIARQLRLRDMGGIIVIDFIDMTSAANRRKIYERMRTLMQNDKVTHKILEITDFGLMQITRQRHRPEQSVDTSEQCPCCCGTGKVESTLILEDEIEGRLAVIVEKKEHKAIEVRMHPFVAAYYEKGFSSRRKKLAKQLRCKLKVTPMSSYNMLEYRFFGISGNEITL